MSFLSGESKMARMIRERDWSNHPLGSPEAWPQALRSALGICLHSAFPTAIYWGPELRLLYNDAWAPIPGPRHPAALGMRARDVWADIWEVIEPQFDHLHRTGEGIFVENQLLPMSRFGIPEETYWDYSFTAIRGERGEIAGVFNSGRETTQVILAQRRMKLMLRLGDRLRGCETPQRVRDEALDLLGTEFGFNRIAVMEADREATVAVLAEEWVAPGAPALAGSPSLDAIAEWARQRLQGERVLRVDDVAALPAGDVGEIPSALLESGIRTLVTVPLSEAGRSVGFALLQASSPRAWHDVEITTIEDFLQRKHEAVAAALAAQREQTMLREMDHRARNTLAVARSLVRLTAANDVASFREKVEGRFAALSRVHSLLASRQWQELEFSQLLRQELAPYAQGREGRFALDGPRIRLAPEVSQLVSLILHELATNAAKHGALATDGGSIRVTWRTSDGRKLLLDWVESSLLADARLSHLGFGSTLLETIVETQLGGSIERRLHPTGLVCRIELALTTPACPTNPRSASASLPEKASAGVLLVEDEPLIAMDMEAMLGDLGVPVFGVCGSVDAALALLRDRIPACAILDLNLAGVPSLPVAQRLRELDVPVIIATGETDGHSSQQASGAVAVLTKPVNSHVLAEALSTLFV